MSEIRYKLGSDEYWDWAYRRGTTANSTRHIWDFIKYELAAKSLNVSVFQSSHTKEKKFVWYINFESEEDKLLYQLTYE